jgi:MFS family permease
MDLSSEMIHGLLPVFLVSTLGASTITLGLIEGIAEGTASIAKIFSGVLSDQMGRRKPLVLLGYGLAALSKPLFPLANSAAWVFVARFADRIGKGIRGAPRDALVADATPSKIRGAAFGLRQALDSAGALLGPLAAIALMYLLADNLRAVFWVAIIPAFIAVAALAVGVEEPQHPTSNRKEAETVHWRDVRALGQPFWAVVVIGTLFTLARFSEAFLIVRASDAGLSLTSTPLALAVMNVTYVASAYPAGLMSDRMGREKLLLLGMGVLVVADVVLIVAVSLNGILFGIALWGLHLGVTQGLLSALVADTAPEHLRGSAFGVFYFATGLATVLASVMAGAVWKWSGPQFTFGVGAVFSAVALIGLIWWSVHYRNARRPA